MPTTRGQAAVTTVAGGTQDRNPTMSGHSVQNTHSTPASQDSLYEMRSSFSVDPAQPRGPWAPASFLHSSQQPLSLHDHPGSLNPSLISRSLSQPNPHSGDLILQPMAPSAFSDGQDPALSLGMMPLTNEPHANAAQYAFLHPVSPLQHIRAPADGHVAASQASLSVDAAAADSNFRFGGVQQAWSLDHTHSPVPLDRFEAVPRSNSSVLGLGLSPLKQRREYDTASPNPYLPEASLAKGRRQSISPYPNFRQGTASPAERTADVPGRILRTGTTPTMASMVMFPPSGAAAATRSLSGPNLTPARTNSQTGSLCAPTCTPSFHPSGTFSPWTSGSFDSSSGPRDSGDSRDASMDSAPMSTSASRTSSISEDHFFAESGERLMIKRKTKLSNLDRKRICEYHLAHPKLKQENLASVFGIERSTVSKVLKDKERWLAIDDDSSVVKVIKHRMARYPDIEEALLTWVRKTQAEGGTISDNDIKKKALQVAEAVGGPADRFKASAGWIEKFKEKAGLRKPRTSAKITRSDGSSQESPMSAAGSSFMNSSFASTSYTPLSSTPASRSASNSSMQYAPMGPHDGSFGSLPETPLRSPDHATLLDSIEAGTASGLPHGATHINDTEMSAITPTSKQKRHYDAISSTNNFQSFPHGGAFQGEGSSRHLFEGEFVDLADGEALQGYAADAKRRRATTSAGHVQPGQFFFNIGPRHHSINGIDGNGPLSMNAPFGSAEPHLEQRRLQNADLSGAIGRGLPVGSPFSVRAHQHQVQQIVFPQADWRRPSLTQHYSTSALPGAEMSTNDFDHSSSFDTSPLRAPTLAELGRSNTSPGQPASPLYRRPRTSSHLDLLQESHLNDVFVVSGGGVAESGNDVGMGAADAGEFAGMVGSSLRKDPSAAAPEGSLSAAASSWDSAYSHRMLGSAASAVTAPPPSPAVSTVQNGAASESASLTVASTETPSTAMLESAVRSNAPLSQALEVLSAHQRRNSNGAVSAAAAAGDAAAAVSLDQAREALNVVMKFLKEKPEEDSEGLTSQREMVGDLQISLEAAANKAAQAALRDLEGGNDQGQRQMQATTAEMEEAHST